MTSFELHPQLAADTYEVLDLPLCRVLLMNDSQYPWLILVPRIASVRDLDELNEADSRQLNDEIRTACAALRSVANPHKLNVAALGNMVEQLHIHVIARNTDDAAWPKPVWGASPAIPYADATSLLEQLRSALSLPRTPESAGFWI